LSSKSNSCLGKQNISGSDTNDYSSEIYYDGIGERSRMVIDHSEIMKNRSKDSKTTAIGNSSSKEILTGNTNTNNNKFNVFTSSTPKNEIKQQLLLVDNRIKKVTKGGGVIKFNQPQNSNTNNNNNNKFLSNNNFGKNNIQLNYQIPTSMNINLNMNMNNLNSCQESNNKNNNNKLISLNQQNQAPLSERTRYPKSPLNSEH
jgi:hypothetical protein